MILSEIPPGASVFIDANVFVYHFAPHPQLQAPCQKFLERILQGEISGVTSTHVLINVAHRLMTIEAMVAYGWPASGIAYRLQRHSTEVQKLTVYRQSVEEVPELGIQVLPVALDHVISATEISQQHGLLSGDALVVAAMHAYGLPHLASHDTDFDRVPEITRYAPA